MRSRNRAFSKKKVLILSLLILLLCMSIGYAVLSSSLKLNAIASVDKMTWDVHLENVVVRSGSVSTNPPTLNNEKTGVTFSVSFKQPNEYYEFYIDVVNKGTIDAQVDSFFKTTLTAEQAKFIDYKITYKDETEIKKNDILNAGEKETLKVLVYIKDLHESLYPSINTTLTLEGKIDYIQKNDDGVVRNKNSLYEEIRKQTQLDSGINFSEPSSGETNGKGVYTLSRTASYAYPVYYYRGDIQNNNVIFGGYCWQIIRTTTTGGIKLIYNGLPNNGVCDKTEEERSIGKSAFNTEKDDPKYVGYMYDNNTKNSTIKEVIDTWFATNLIDYLNYLEDTPFYNERDYKVSEPQSTYLHFAPKLRIWKGLAMDSHANTTIKLGAANVSDIFTVSESIGNGALTYPIGLITSDEMILAGNIGRTNGQNENINCYLSINVVFWTMSPHSYGDWAYVNNMDKKGFLSWGGNTAGAWATRPVVSLKPTTFISGDGTYSTPYIITN